MAADKRLDLDELRGEVASLPPATWAARIRALMPIIERRLAEGLGSQQIVDLLNEYGEQGRKLTRDHFWWVVKRHRRQAGRNRPDTTAGPPEVAASPPVEERRHGTDRRGTERAGLPAPPPAPPASRERTVVAERTDGERTTEGRGNPLSKADLKQVRSREVDLDALAKLARDDDEER